MTATRETSKGQRLRVRINDELILDAGTCEEVSGSSGPECRIRPPETSMFHQVLDYLRAKPDPPKRPSGSIVGREGVAAAAVVLRWGSYLAALLDRDKPVPPEVRVASTCRISDEEMARINIEASAALGKTVCLHLARRSQRSWLEQVLPFGPNPIALSDDIAAAKTARGNWARFIKKVFELDPLLCPDCGGVLKIIAFIDNPKVVRTILTHLALWDVPKPRPPPVPVGGNADFECVPCAD